MFAKYPEPTGEPTGESTGESTGKSTGEVSSEGRVKNLLYISLCISIIFCLSSSPPGSVFGGSTKEAIPGPRAYISAKRLLAGARGIIGGIPTSPSTAGLVIIVCGRSEGNALSRATLLNSLEILISILRNHTARVRLNFELHAHLV